MIDDDPGMAKVLGGDAGGITGCFPIRDQKKKDQLECLWAG
jgi:hypothetical protein